MIYLIRLWPAPGLTNEAVEGFLNLEQDWIRIEEMSWLVRSNRYANDLSRMLTPLVQNGRHLIIQVEKDNVQGAMLQAFWDWLHKRDR